MKIRNALLATLFSAATLSPAFAADVRPFFENSTQTGHSVTGLIKGSEPVRYSFDGKDGEQTMVFLRTMNVHLNFNIVDSRGRQIHNSEKSRNYRYNAALPATGRYIIAVYQTDARNNLSISYGLTVKKGSAPAALHPVAHK